MEWNGRAFSHQDAVTETSVSFQKLWTLLHSGRSCGLATRAVEAQPKLWPWSDPQTDSPAAKKIPEESRYWRHQGKMGPGRFWRQPSLVQVMATSQPRRGGVWGGPVDLVSLLKIPHVEELTCPWAWCFNLWFVGWRTESAATVKLITVFLGALFFIEHPLSSLLLRWLLSKEDFLCLLHTGRMAIVA